MGLQIVSGVVPTPAERVLHMFTAVDPLGADLCWAGGGSGHENGARVGVIGDFAFACGTQKAWAARDFDVHDGWLFLLPRSSAQAAPFVYWGFKGRSEVTGEPAVLRPSSDLADGDARPVTTSTFTVPASQHIVFYVIVESVSDPDIHAATVDNVFVFCWGYL